MLNTLSCSSKNKKPKKKLSIYLYQVNYNSKVHRAVQSTIIYRRQNSLVRKLLEIVWLFVCLKKKFFLKNTVAHNCNTIKLCSQKLVRKQCRQRKRRRSSSSLWCRPVWNCLLSFSAKEINISWTLLDVGFISLFFFQPKYCRRRQIFHFLLFAKKKSKKIKKVQRIKKKFVGKLKSCLKDGNITK